MRKNKLAVLSAVALSGMIMFSGCGEQKTADTHKDAKKCECKDKEKCHCKDGDCKCEDKDKKEEGCHCGECDASKKEVSLSQWAGTWNDMSRYLDKPELQKAFEALAKKEKVTPEEAKAKYKEKRKNDIAGLVIEGNKITFLDNFKDKGGKEVDSSDYEFVKAQKFSVGKAERVWNIFKAKKADAKYPIMMLMAIDKDEPLLHFHMRYGKTVEEALAKDKWFPTFVSPASSDELLIDEISE